MRMMILMVMMMRMRMRMMMKNEDDEDWEGKEDEDEDEENEDEDEEQDSAHPAMALKVVLWFALWPRAGAHGSPWGQRPLWGYDSKTHGLKCLLGAQVVMTGAISVRSYPRPNSGRPHD